jgi:hypothetical protein
MLLNIPFAQLRGNGPTFHPLFLANSKVTSDRHTLAIFERIPGTPDLPLQTHKAAPSAPG